MATAQPTVTRYTAPVTEKKAVIESRPDNGFTYAEMIKDGTVIRINTISKADHENLGWKFVKEVK